MRVGIIGSNFIVQRFLAAAKSCDAFFLQAVCSRDRARAEQNALEWGASDAYDSVAALAANPRVETVYIASPNSVHFEQAALLLRHRKHVLVEKPATLNLQLWDTLLAIARENQVLLLEAMRPAYLPYLKVIQNALEQIGPIRYANFSYCQYSSRYDRFQNGVIENAFNPTLGNGALMDIGVYCVWWMVALLGKPQQAEGHSVFLPRSIDAMGSATACYPGLTAQCVYSKVHDSFAPSRIEGEKGTLELTALPIPNRMRLTLRQNGEGQEVELQPVAEDMRYEIQRFIQLCENPEQAMPYQNLTSDTLWVLDSIRETAGIDFKIHP